MSTARPALAVDAAGCAAAALLYRSGGKLFATAAVKAAFTLVGGGPMRLGEPEPLVRGDVPSEPRDPGGAGSLALASELVPYRPRVDVLLVGHACAVPGKPVSHLRVALRILRGERAVLDKTVLVEGDPGGAFGAERQPFERMPLVWERAVGGPDRDDNPVGVGRARANLVDPSSPDRPACFAPISSRWPARRRLLGGFDPARLAAPLPELPGDFPWVYFQAAPPDQRLPALRGDELIVLAGLHPRWLELRTAMPRVAVDARLETQGAVSGRARPFALWADALTIDTDRLVATLCWRGQLEVDEAELASLRLVARVAPADAPGAGVTRAEAPRAHDTEPERPRKPPAGRRELNPLMRTAVASATAGTGPALPFAPARGAAPAAPRPASTPPPARSPSTPAPTVAFPSSPPPPMPPLAAPLDGAPDLEPEPATVAPAALEVELGASHPTPFAAPASPATAPAEAPRRRSSRPPARREALRATMPEELFQTLAGVSVARAPLPFQPSAARSGAPAPAPAPVAAPGLAPAPAPAPARAAAPRATLDLSTTQFAVAPASPSAALPFASPEAALRRRSEHPPAVAPVLTAAPVGGGPAPHAEPGYAWGVASPAARARPSTPAPSQGAAPSAPPPPLLARPLEEAPVPTTPGAAFLAILAARRKARSG